MRLKKISNIARENELIHIPLNKFLEWIKEGPKHPDYGIDYFKTRRISIPVNKDNLIENSIVAEKDTHLILNSLNLNLLEKDQFGLIKRDRSGQEIGIKRLEKKDIMILDLISELCKLTDEELEAMVKANETGVIGIA